MLYFFFFFFNDTATPEIYPLSLPDALPIFSDPGRRGGLRRRRSWHRQRPRGGSGRGARVSVAGSFAGDRKSTRLNSSHSQISYAVFCLKKKKKHHPLSTHHAPRIPILRVDV